MSMVCEKGWGGQAADSDWSVRPPTPFGMAFGRLKLSPLYTTLCIKSRVETKMHFSIFAKIMRKWHDFREISKISRKFREKFLRKRKIH
jgi:hypothetical protein